MPPAPPDSLHLRVIHATSRFVIVDKPAGLLSVPGRGPDNQDCVPARVRVMFPRATGPLVVHRLDMDTSGLLVLGLDEDAQRDFSRQFEMRQVDKQYTALVAGLVESQSGVIDIPVRPDFTNRPYQVADPAHEKPATTAWSVLSLETDRSRLRLLPHTGRTHQLRVHCAHPAPVGLGHPIIGDVLYGPQPETGNAGPRLMLHAESLTITNPATGERQTFASPPPF